MATFSFTTPNSNTATMTLASWTSLNLRAAYQ